MPSASVVTTSPSSKTPLAPPVGASLRVSDAADLSGPLDPHFADAVHVPDPDVIVAAGGGEGPAIDGAGDSRQPWRPAVERDDQLAGGQAPEAHLPVVARGG